MNLQSSLVGGVGAVVGFGGAVVTGAVVTGAVVGFGGAVVTGAGVVGAGVDGTGAVVTGVGGVVVGGAGVTGQAVLKQEISLVSYKHLASFGTMSLAIGNFTDPQTALSPHVKYG